MHLFRIIQIGDVHFTDKENTDSPVDNKDPAFPKGLAASLGTPPLQAVFRGLAKAIADDLPDLVAFMGDYTNRGDETGLAECLRYLRGLLPETWTPTGTPTCQLLIGNHDVDRRKDPEADQRFNDINAVITGAGFPPASVLAPEELPLTGPAGSELRVYGVNSCRGCGQVRLLGPLLARKAGPEIRRILDEGDEAELNEIYEGIDTPAIDDGTLHGIGASIRTLGESVLPVVCAHHNILPQTTPRLAPYSELVNAGAVRAALLSTNRPLIFLHGHLHDDPVEIVRSPEHPRAAIISVSAPLLRLGFNTLAVAFNNEGVPLGCEIGRLRLQGSELVRQPPLTVPVWDAREGLQMVSAAGRDLMRDLQPDRVFSRADLLRDTGRSEAALDGSIEELRWLGLVQVQNPERPSMHWRLTRAV